MKEVFKEIPFGIEHTLKVLKNAEDIMKGENIGEEEKEFISIIAILHDIGAVEAQKKYGSIDGVYQEKEGPEVAKEILKKVGLVLCQDLVQVKMRNFSHFNPPEAQPQCVFFHTIVRIHLVTYSCNGYEFVSYCRKLPDIQKSTGMPAYNRGF